MTLPPFAVSHVVLDVDGTLVDFVGALRRALEAAAARCSEASGTLVTPRALQQSHHLVAADPAWAAHSLAEVRVESIRRVLATAGVTDEVAVAGAADAFFRTRNETMTVYPDVRETLDDLRAVGLTLIAASNGNADLDVPGLAHYFAATFFAGEQRVMKPDPAFFVQAVERGGGRPEAAAAVGDRLDNDYEPARAAGLHSVLLDRDGEVDDVSVLRIRTLTELPGMLRPL